MLPERPRPPGEDNDKNENEDKSISEQVRLLQAKQKRWLPALGKTEYIILLLSWTSYSIFNVLAYRNGGAG